MKQDSSAHNRLTVRSKQHPVERAPRPIFSKDSLEKKLQALQEKASGGDHQSHIRIEAIHRLVDPCLHFCESDVKRILSKGYPPQVEKGLQLYRLMRRLRLFCEPKGETIGAACRVQLINFEKLTLSSLLDIKAADDLVRRATEKGYSSENFDGMALLKPEEKALYKRLTPYFGGRKRPTLKSLAISLLGEGNDIFTDRTATNYLAAVRTFKIKHKEDLDFTWGSTWSVVGVINSYNLNAETGRETARRVVINLAEAAKTTGLPNFLVGIAQGFRESLMPKSFFDGFTRMAETKNAFAEYQRGIAEGLKMELFHGIQQDVLAARFNFQAETLKAMGAGINALAASQLGFESRLRAIAAGFPMQESFARYFPIQKAD